MPQIQTLELAQDRIRTLSPKRAPNTSDVLFLRVASRVFALSTREKVLERKEQGAKVIFTFLHQWRHRRDRPAHLVHGELGERAAKKHLKRQGLKFLTANFRSPRGEIDLVFRDGDCLVFVEVKTRSSEAWERPAAAVDDERRHRLTRAGLDYLHLLKNPAVKVRFDIVEVLLKDGAVNEVRHLVNTFAMSQPYRYG